MAVNWPGQLTFDSVVQLQEGRTGKFGNWHPPVMSWLLGIFDRILPGAGLFVAFDAALLFGGLALAFVLRPKSSWASVLVALLCVVTPQYLLYAGDVWKDVLFAGSATLGFLVLAWTAGRWEHAPRRMGGLSLALVFLSLATLARQNGAVVLPFAAFAVGWIAHRKGGRAPILNRILYGAGWLGAVLIVTASAWFALHTHVVGPNGPKGQFRLLATYDLAGALHDDPRLVLDRLHDDDPALESLMRTDAARLYTPQRNDTLARSSALQAALLDADEETIPAQWRDFILTHPLFYLRLRWDAFRWVFFTPDGFACRAVFAGVTGPPPVLQELGLAARFDARDRVLYDYGLAFTRTPVFSHAFFAALAIVFLFFLLRRRSESDIAVAASLLASFGFALSFFVISIACDYRYLYFVDIATLTALAYLAPDIPELWRDARTRRLQTKGPSA